MRALIQRVRSASVQIDGEIVGEIDKGLLILLGVEHDDDLSDVAWLSGKVAGMRIFSDATGKMNASVTDVGGSALIVSQFTLHASTKKGNRPSFIRAARPEHATPLYEAFVAALGEHVPVATGRFGAMMDVTLVNEGPVTIWMDSRNRE